MPMPPSPAPNQASEEANDGIARAPPVSAAIVFRATIAIHGPPNAIARIASDMLATTHDAFDFDAGAGPGRHSASRPTRSDLAAPSRTSP